MPAITTTPDNSGSSRSTAAERREHLLGVALEEFATRGYAGGSTERIATAAGISQPYVFRLFGSKLQLFLAVIERCLDDMYALMDEASAELQGDAALHAMGEAYLALITTDPIRLQGQLVGYVASAQSEEVRATMRQGFGRLVELAERRSGADETQISAFFAKGMLLNVVTAMGLGTDPTTWGTRLIAGCIDDDASAAKRSMFGLDP